MKIIREYVKFLLEDEEKFVVKHHQTGKIHGPYKGRRRAQNVADKLDNKYGAIITSVEPAKN